MDHDEEVLSRRGFPEMQSDKDIYRYARIVSGGWFRNGRKNRFVDYKLNESMKEHPYHDLTLSEYARLRLIQANLQDREKKDESEKNWKLVKTKDWGAYVQELWESSTGESKIITKIVE